MPIIKAAIIDDEISATENISLILETHCPKVIIVGVANSISEGVKLIKDRQPDLLFLDISMPPEGTGFDLLELFPKRNFQVIFTTAYEEHSLKALKEHAFDYLLKPIDFEEVTNAITDFRIQFKNRLLANAKKNPIITLSTEQGIHLINSNDILFCKASGSYTEFHLLNEPSILISKSLKHAQSLLVTENFKRIHRSFLVNQNHISKLIKDSGDFVCINEVKIPVSKKYYSDLYDLVPR